MPDKDELTKIPAETKVAHEIKILAASKGKYMYEFVEEMLETYKAAQAEMSPKEWHKANRKRLQSKKA